MPPVGAAVAGFDAGPELAFDPPVLPPAEAELPETAPLADPAAAPPPPPVPPLLAALVPVDVPPDEFGEFELPPVGEAAELPPVPGVTPLPPEPLPSAAAVADRTSELGTRRPQLLMVSATKARPTNRVRKRLLPTDLPPAPAVFTEPPVL